MLFKLQGQFLFSKIKLLFYGNIVQKIDENDHLRQVSVEEVFSGVFRYNKSQLLLGKPFVLTFMHETTILSARELKELDSRYFNNRNNETQNRKVVSFRLSGTKFLTIHTHLTQKGVALLEHFRGHHMRCSWESAIAAMIGTLNFHINENDCRNTVRRIFLEGELLQILPQVDYNRYNYVPFWDEKKNSEQSEVRLANALLGSTVNGRVPENIFLRSVEPNFVVAAESVFSDLKQRKNASTISWKGRPPMPKIKFKLDPLRVVVFCFVLIFIWSVGLQLMVTQKKEERDRLRASLKKLDEKTHLLDQLKETEQKYYQWTTLRETLEETRLHPVAIMKNIEITVPLEMWLSEINLNKQAMSLELFATDNVEISPFMHELKKNGDWNAIELEENVFFQLNEHQVRKYLLRTEGGHLGKISSLGKE